MNQEKTFDKIYYVGDGGNDFCPFKIDFPLNTATAFVRSGYELEKKL